jgi:hypothetical protein
MKARQDDTPHLGEEESIILDMSKKKTELTLKAVKTILHEQFAVEAGNVRQLIEGEVSQAFSFECAEIGYVIRIGKAIEGFSILDPRSYFWSSWLDCMAAQAAYYNACLSAIPGYQERIVCYQLRIGLAEVYDNVMHQNWKMARWAAKRSAEIALLAHTEHS